MASRPVVIVHGYSDQGKTASNWCRLLTQAGFDATNIHVSEYVSLSNEVTIKDIAEGLDRGLRIQAGLSKDEEFDAIVHSTGMLVIRAWLTTYASRAARLKHLVGLAPATFGSPMAHKGRSLLGGIFKGTKKFGPDFMEAGDRVLAGLELGSAFTWDLAHKDFVTTTPSYGPDGTTPYPFIFIGLKDYGFVKRIATEPAPTARCAGPAPGSTPARSRSTSREKRTTHASRRVRDWSNVRVPLVLLANHNHGTIFGAPTTTSSNRCVKRSGSRPRRYRLARQAPARQRAQRERDRRPPLAAVRHPAGRRARRRIPTTTSSSTSATPTASFTRSKTSTSTSTPIATIRATTASTSISTRPTSNTCPTCGCA
jgi:hypothetical protein